MRNLLIGVLLTFLVLLTFKYCSERKEDRITIQENSALIQEQIKNVGKLVVTEGHFSQVFTYKNSKDIFANLINVEKKALVVVNAEVTVAYDLSQIEYEIDEESKILRITKIPQEEIKINPDFEYYHVQADFLNQFEAKDYNTIKNKVRSQLMKKIENSELKKNAENRLISELSKFYILTNTLGWTLEYQSMPISQAEDLNRLDL